MTSLRLRRRRRPPPRRRRRASQRDRGNELIHQPFSEPVVETLIPHTVDALGSILRIVHTYFTVLMKRLGAAAVIIVTSMGAAQAVARASSEPSCRTMAPRIHTNAVFGHFATRDGAKAYKATAVAKGFRGLRIVNNGCGDYELYIGGADRQRDRSSFSTEAHSAGFHITFQQSAPPLQYEANRVVGVLGSFQSLARANALLWTLSDQGFVYLDIARAPSRWLVVMPEVPIKSALPIAKEVATAGFHIQFQPGVKP